MTRMVNPRPPWTEGSTPPNLPLQRGGERGCPFAQSGGISHCRKANPLNLFFSHAKRGRPLERVMTFPNSRLAVEPPTLHG